MKKIIIIISILLNSIILYSQKPKFSALTPRNTIHFGFESFPLFVYSTANKNLHSGFVLRPRIDYFILNRFSVGLSYFGIYTFFTKTKQYNLYFNNGEINLTYFFYDNRRVLLYFEGSYSVGQYKLESKADSVLTNHYKIGHIYTYGPGINWKMKKLPELNFNFHLKTCMSLLKSDSGGVLLMTFGINYYMQRKPKNTE